MTYERPVLSLDANHTGVLPVLLQKLCGGRLSLLHCGVCCTYKN